MTLTLFTSPASPFVRKTRVLLRETGQEDVIEHEVNTTALASDPALVAATPLAKIPALTRSDGPTIFDSRVICRFLDARSGGSLYPDSRLWEVLTLEALADGIMEGALSIAYERRFRDDAQQSPDWIEGQWAKVARALDALEAQWLSHLHGPLTMAQIAIGCALGYLDLRHDDRGWRNGHPGLAAWFAEFGARPSMQATAPPPA